MRSLIKVAGGFGIVAASFFATLWYMDYSTPSCSWNSAIRLSGPFEIFPPSGTAYSKMLPALAAGDTQDNPTQSPLLLCENGKPLGPMHAAHGEIIKDGRHRYSHWGKMLIFSTSDNTDPNGNGRSYSVVDSR